MAHGMIAGCFHHSFDRKHNFEQFAKNFGKQFGAYILARDKPADFEITDEFWEVEDYHLKAIERAEVIVRAYDTGDDVALRVKFSEIRQARIDKATQDIREIEDQIARVKEWQRIAQVMEPLTGGHVSIVDAMREQLAETLQECYCIFDAVKNRLHEAERLVYDEWKAAEYDEAVKAIEYHKKAHMEEVERQQRRREWHEVYMKMIADAQAKIAQLDKVSSGLV
jgi:hypothetical protein